MPTGDGASRWSCARPACGECDASWLFCSRCGQPRPTVPPEDDMVWLGDRLREIANGPYAENAGLRRELEILVGVRDCLQRRVEDLRGRLAIVTAVVFKLKGKIQAAEKTLRRVLSGNNDSLMLHTMACDMEVMAAEVESLLATLYEQADEDLRFQTARVLAIVGTDCQPKDEGR